MADQATVSRNGKSASHQAAKSIAGLTHDVVSLCELQAKLASCDVKDMSRGLILPAVLTIVIVLTLLGAIFTFFLAGAYALVDFAGWPQVAAFAASGGAGLLLTIVLGLIVWFTVRGSIHKLNRSREEFAENLQAFKSMLKDQEAVHRTQR